MARTPPPFARGGIRLLDKRADVLRTLMAVAQTKQSANSAQGLLPSADLAANQTSVPEFSKEQELLALRQMLLIRRFEEKAGQMYGMGLMGGFCHLYIGQGAIVVGLKLA